jgi:hypothetical protein
MSPGRVGSGRCGAATGSYGDLELVYTVAFPAADLFGTDVDHILTADLGEGELEAA